MVLTSEDHFLYTSPKYNVGIYFNGAYIFKLQIKNNLLNIKNWRKYPSIPYIVLLFENQNYYL